MASDEVWLALNQRKSGECRARSDCTDLALHSPQK